MVEREMFHANVPQIVSRTRGAGDEAGPTLQDLLRVLPEKFRNGEIKEVIISIDNSGVYTDGRDYWTKTDVTIVVDGKEYEFTETADYGSSVWLSNSTGAGVESLANELMRELEDIAFDKAVEALGGDYDDTDELGNPYKELDDGRTVWAVVFDYWDFHSAGRHIYSYTIKQPKLEVVEG